ncbi:hypothetical protein [Streptomyces lunaelactis]|uniref:hypothetical protein n=1 Tax=Streptomyces lunaelactis TaxID=1535768 RepID=UPI001584E11A|nr:hypothetical protein [Streptomyces lunaelactis]NUK04722.1 hypothetical protein [Streptomyces lunaelactis]NUK20901.1 hypothetical protein [Streptomyces lunaelactis]
MSIKQPQTDQYKAFTANLAYARNMVNAARNLHALRLGAVDIDDLYRAAWVQAVSALDHWLHEELFRRVREIVETPGAEKPQQLQNLALPLSVVEEIRLNETTTADAVDRRVRAAWEYAPLHNAEKIQDAYRLVTNKKLWGEAATQINAWHHGRTKWNDKTLAKHYQAIINRRNKIAHSSDLEDGELGKRRPITEAETSDAIDWIERVALAFATVLG